MGNVIDFKDAVKIIRKKTSKGVTEASELVGKGFKEFYENSFKAADTIASKMSNKKITIEERAKRSANKFKQVKDAEIAASRKAFNEAKTGSQLSFDLGDVAKNSSPNVSHDIKPKEIKTKDVEQLSFDIDEQVKKTKFKTETGTQTSMFDGGQQTLIDMGPSMDTTAYSEALKVDAENIRQKRKENKVYNRQELEKKLEEVQYNKNVNKFYNRPELEKKYKEMKPKINGNNWVYKAAAASVGGGLVLSMANNKGQQTNNQLYGQGGYR